MRHTWPMEFLQAVRMPRDPDFGDFAFVTREATHCARCGKSRQQTRGIRCEPKATTCHYPDNPEDGSSPPEGFDTWADPSGLCEHEHCAEGNRIGRQYRASAHMTADDIEAIRADRELVADEYHGLWVMDFGGYIVTVDEGV